MWMQRNINFQLIFAVNMDVHRIDGKRLSSLGPRQPSIGTCVADSESWHNKLYWRMPSWQIIKLGLVKAIRTAPWLHANRYC